MKHKILLALATSLVATGCGYKDATPTPEEIADFKRACAVYVSVKKTTPDGDPPSKILMASEIPEVLEETPVVFNAYFEDDSRMFNCEIAGYRYFDNSEDYVITINGSVDDFPSEKVEVTRTGDLDIVVTDELGAIGSYGNVLMIWPKSY